MVYFMQEYIHTMQSKRQSRNNLLAQPVYFDPESESSQTVISYSQ